MKKFLVETTLVRRDWIGCNSEEAAIDKAYDLYEDLEDEEIIDVEVVDSDEMLPDDYVVEI